MYEIFNRGKFSSYDKTRYIVIYYTNKAPYFKSNIKNCYIAIVKNINSLIAEK